MTHRNRRIEGWSPYTPCDARRAEDCPPYLTFNRNKPVTSLLKNCSVIRRRISGRADAEDHRRGIVGEATPGEISFFTNRKYIALLRKTRASAVFVRRILPNRSTPAQVRVPIQPRRSTSRAQICAEAITSPPVFNPSAVVDAASACQRVFDSTASSHRTRCKDWGRHDHCAGSYVGHETIIGPRVTFTRM